MTSTATATILSNNWQWRQRDLAKEPLQHDGDDRASESAGADASSGDGWTNCVAFPSEIHVELLKARKIPDPYLGFSEHKVQCTFLAFLVVA